MPGAPVAFGKPSWEPSGAFHTARCACRCPVSSAPPTQGVVRAAFGKPPGGGGAGRGVPAPRSLRRRCPGLPTRRRRCATSLETGDICSVPEGGLMGRVWPRGFRGPQRPRGRGCQRDPLQCCVARSGDGHTVEGGGRREEQSRLVRLQGGGALPRADRSRPRRLLLQVCVWVAMVFASPAPLLACGRKRSVTGGAAEEPEPGCLGNSLSHPLLGSETPHPVSVTELSGLGRGP